MTIERPPFPTVLDSSLISAFRSCRQKAYLEYLAHWKPKTLSVHLHAGKAFAEGLEKAREAFFLHGVEHEEAVKIGLGALLKAYGNFECPEDSAKSASRMAGALVYYFDTFDMRKDKAVPVTMPGGKKGIEFSFSEPIDVTHPVTGDPLLYVGRMDMIAEYAGAIYGEDDKTTSSLGASWSKQWDLRSQFTGYTWGAKRAGFPLQGFLIRGVSILKTKYDHAEAITYRPQWQIDRWYEQLIRDVTAMKQAWESGYWDYNLDHACAEFGGCVFSKICLSTDKQTWLDADFERRVWDPVTRTEYPYIPIQEVQA